MSEELIKSLNGRVAELEKRKAQLEVALRGERKDLKALKEELDTVKAGGGKELDTVKAQLDELTRDRDGWKAKAESAPSEKDARIAELETLVRTVGHRDAFNEAVGKELAEGWSVEDLWHFGGFDPAKVETLDSAQITELVGKVKAAKPGMFVTPEAPGNGANPQGARPPLKAPLDAGRGARDTASGTVRYAKSEVQQPNWMNTPRGKQIVEARNAGTAVMTDE